jgi:polysaccharide export outer membrane protein
MQVKLPLSLMLLAGLAGCASLPSNGPTGRQIVKSASDPRDGSAPIRIVEIRTVTDMAQVDQPVPPPAILADLVPPPTDMIGPGDVLDINIYEAGVALFSGARAGTGTDSQIAVTPGVQVQRLPPSRVDDNGAITIPYAGRLPVAGHTISEVEAMIRQSLRRMSQNPQVLVTLSQAITNSIIVGGEVAKPGRLVLQTNRETLSDVVALAGGYRGNAKDLTLRVMRGTESIDVRVNDLAEIPGLDARVRPGDRLLLISNPRTFSVLGASGRVEQIPFSRSSVSLAEAVANAGGVNSSLGNPAAIFLFRYVDDEQGQAVPMVYHLNMMNAGSYFLAQRFMMRDRDVLYFGNAAANQPSKLIQLISQLFSPILTVTSTVQVLQNSNK